MLLIAKTGGEEKIHSKVAACVYKFPNLLILRIDMEENLKALLIYIAKKICSRTKKR